MSHLLQTDPQIFQLAEQETDRQNRGLTLIPSENHTSPAVLEALATTLSDKYAEGYPGRRYYAGNAIVDQLESLVQTRAKTLFGVPYVNVQPYSGSPANLAVYLATLEPGDVFCGLDLPHGGHLTHGWKTSATAKLWKSIPYHARPDGQPDLEELRTLALTHKPKLIWCGGTALARAVDFKGFAAIADEVGALLVADISHISGLIVGGAHESPVPYAHIVTTTTHKTLRGPRGAMIMVTEKGLQKDPNLAAKFDSAIIPGLQGGPHLNTIAGIGVALLEAAKPEFKTYASQVVKNAITLAEELKKHGFDLVSDGTDNHLLLVDLTKTGTGRGTLFHEALERIGIYANKNTVPTEQSSPFYPSGLRLGTPAVTTRGMKEPEMKKIAEWIKRVGDHIQDVQLTGDKEARMATLQAFRAQLQSDAFFESLHKEVEILCVQFPIPAYHHNS
jgi:glycine hydroxymethyltransferase